MSPDIADLKFIGMIPMRPPRDIIDENLARQLLQVGRRLFPELRNWRDEAQKQYVVAATCGHRPSAGVSEYKACTLPVPLSKFGIINDTTQALQ